MIETRIFNPPITLLTQEKLGESMEINRLLAAAVVNQNFSKLLLEDPELAIDTGLQGETFLLTEEERCVVLSIRAESLTDLATQLARSITGHDHILVDTPVQSTAGSRF